MIDQATLSAGLAEIRGLLQADGGDMELVSVDQDAGTVRTRLILEGASCRECVLPRALLERVGLDILQKNADGVRHLDIEDPRES
ncbi:MAG TPA: NifU family protein [Amycolatopsis sp.]|nr:NifU family protein [Amycolatopsis sp.]